PRKPAQRPARGAAGSESRDQAEPAARSVTGRAADEIGAAGGTARSRSCPRAAVCGPGGAPARSTSAGPDGNRHATAARCLRSDGERLHRPSASPKLQYTGEEEAGLVPCTTITLA